jgi:glycosyltransferase involved in cell wall biosynthesis
VALVEQARARGIVTVREMINCQLKTSRNILARAYSDAGLGALQPIAQGAVEAELRELRLYDYIVAPAPMVEASLIDCGIAPGRILAESYGWSPQRFPVRASVEGRKASRFLFVGTLCVRKGIPQLLRAWEWSRIAGELTLVGDVEPALAGLVEAAVRSGSVRHVRYTDDVGAFYAGADAFVFPTLEEGCPQVTMEAAGCGLPIITTQMGAGRLIRDGSNGIVIDGNDVMALARAMRTVAGDLALRRRLSGQVAVDALQFTYEKVSAKRAVTFSDIVASRQRSKTQARLPGVAEPAGARMS